MKLAIINQDTFDGKIVEMKNQTDVRMLKYLISIILNRDIIGERFDEIMDFLEKSNDIGKIIYMANFFTKEAGFNIKMGILPEIKLPGKKV